MQLTSGIQVIETEFWGRPLYLALFVDEQVALVDTGLVGMGETDVIPCMRSLGKSSEDLSLIINTHAHADHIGGNRELWLASGKRARFAAHRMDVPWIEDPPSQGPGLYQRYVDLGLIEAASLADSLKAAGEGTKVDLVLEGDERFALGQDLELRIVSAPGHTLGNISVYEPASKVLVHGESVAGRGQFDTNGKLLGVPSYDDVGAYLETVARLARMDFVWFVSSHVPPMKCDAAAKYFAESLEFALGFDAEVQNRLRSATGALSTLDLLGSMEDLWGEYPADTGMAMLIDAHLRSLLNRGVIHGSLEDGVTWEDSEDNRFEALVEAARSAVAALSEP
ncbi:MAG: MBL fold metallo-hydrolase [Chloroflexota bacterium]